MDQFLRVPSLMAEVRGLGWTFSFPIILIFSFSFFIYSKYGGVDHRLPLQLIQNTLGIFPISFISLWVIHLFQDIVNKEGKELLLSLPYRPLSYGLFRVVRMTLLYMMIFLPVLFFLVHHGREVATAADWYLPIVTIMFFSSLSFFIVLLTKNRIISYGVIGVYGAFQYMSRGGFTGPFYSFHWANPKPLMDSITVAISLGIQSIILLILAQWLLHKREFLAR